MNLIPWRNRQPSRRSSELASLIDRFFDRDSMFDHLPEWFGSGSQPALNISEDENNFVATLELPGMEMKDIDVQVIGNQLQVSGERRFEDEKKDREFHRVESQYGSFLRTITLPQNLKTDQVDATYKNGVLTLSIPKVEPTPAKRIAVKGG